MSGDDWKARLRNEEAELADRLVKLTRFIGGPEFQRLHPCDQVLLLEQQGAMAKYGVILKRRVERL